MNNGPYGEKSPILFSLSLNGIPLMYSMKLSHPVNPALLSRFIIFSDTNAYITSPLALGRYQPGLHDNCHSGGLEIQYEVQSAHLGIWDVDFILQISRAVAKNSRKLMPP